MKHFLNTELKGKANKYGLLEYPIYFRFTVNRQTFKIKSRIINRSYSEFEFSDINQPLNVFIAKDNEIVEYCIRQSMDGSLLNIGKFKVLYTQNCTSIILWLKKHISTSPQRIMDEFMLGSTVTSRTENSILKIETKYNLDRYKVLSYLNGFHQVEQNKPGLNKHLLIFDWKHKNLSVEFSNHFKSIHHPDFQVNNVVLFINEMVKLI